MRQLPSLNALYVFEAVARHMSFQQAAEELDVSATAVSHQIRLLETELGMSLFRRRPRPLALTTAGQTLFPAVQASLDILTEAIACLEQTPNSTELTVSLTNVFAAKWLVPRLPDFQKQHPEIDVRLQTSNTVIDLKTRSVDMAIRYGRGSYPGLAARPFLSDTFAPVCSPRLLTGKHPLNHPADLVHYSLLHCEWSNDDPEAPSWKRWFALTDVHVDAFDPERGLKFDEENLVIQAAIAGQGIALCSSIHVVEDIASGLLVRPFDIFLPGLTYAAVYLKAHPNEASILKFVDWLTR